MEKVEQLRELLAKATPGPWQSKDPYLWDEIVGNIDGPDDGQYHYTEVAQAFGRADAALIVAAVSALPGLLDTIAALEARVRELEAALHDQRWQHAQELKRAEQAEAALAVVRKLPAKWRSGGPDTWCGTPQAGNCADELSAAIAHGGAGEGEKNG